MIKNNLIFRNILFLNKKFYTTTCSNLIETKEVLPDLDIDLDLPNLPAFENDVELKPFKTDEILFCKIINKSIKHEKYNCRIINLEKNGIFRTKNIDVFHEHIIHKSCIERTVRFEMGDRKLEFRRPSLYEYITLKEQQAVSSHFSIVTIVPLLLEIGRSSKVFEAGTGSGSMSLFLSERLGYDGCLHTFDVCKIKSQKAKKYFWEWKNSYDLSSVEKWPANVKFGTMNMTSDDKWCDRMKEFYDCVYLDMANLDLSIYPAYKMLKQDGVLVLNAMHLTQVYKCLNRIEELGLGLEKELVLEPGQRFWEMRKIKDTNGLLDWTGRLEDRFVEKYKRGGLFFNYWQGFLVKFRKFK